MASAARKAAEAAMLPFRDGPHLTTKVTAEAVWNLVVAIDALLSEQDGAGAHGCINGIAGCPHGATHYHRRHDGETWGIVCLDDEVTRAFDRLASRPAPSPASDEVREALAEIVEWAASEGPCSCNVDSPVECWLCRWHDRATAALAARPAVAKSDEVRERLMRAEALLLDVWDSHHREGWEPTETFDSVMDRLGDWRWGNGFDPYNPPLRTDPRAALAARGERGE